MPPGPRAASPPPSTSAGPTVPDELRTPGRAAEPEPEYRPDPPSRPEPEYRPEPRPQPEPEYRPEPGRRWDEPDDRPEPEYRPGGLSEPGHRHDEPGYSPEPVFRQELAYPYASPSGSAGGSEPGGDEDAESLETLSLSDPKQPSDRRLLQYLLETNRRLTEDAEMRLKREGGQEDPNGYPPRRPAPDPPPTGSGDAGREESQTGSQQDLPVVQRPREYLAEREPEERPAPDDEPMRHHSQKEQDTTDLLERHRRLNEDSRRLLRDS